MFYWGVRDRDTPPFWFRGIRTNHSSWLLKMTEVFVIGDIIMVFIREHPKCVKTYYFVIASVMKWSEAITTYIAIAILFDL